MPGEVWHGSCALSWPLSDSACIYRCCGGWGSLSASANTQALELVWIRLQMCPLLVELCPGPSQRSSARVDSSMWCSATKLLSSNTSYCEKVCMHQQKQLQVKLAVSSPVGKAMLAYADTCCPRRGRSLSPAFKGVTSALDARSITICSTGCASESSQSVDGTPAEIRHSYSSLLSRGLELPLSHKAPSNCLVSPRVQIDASLTCRAGWQQMHSPAPHLPRLFAVLSLCTAP